MFLFNYPKRDSGDNHLNARGKEDGTKHVEVAVKDV